ncbi:hypothetical protein GCM10027566_14700 [Arachidicoccus ginsenosidivorans]|jgi:hypothetical protein|uniref:DUF5008 domain-containing protein n=1 Tax=Arachidicoccus ginsenosidivorans TaxID=496057 RepID=A0A5B8VLB1_9BACT|nr:DUF5008 domain-containing protein [Arachidicoccus ginsenosidivorans]QEC71048.1 DUF5008 domain-containing protein [Arachidicoccus ginsenosidivorans]
MNKVAFKYYYLLVFFFAGLLLFSCNKESNLGSGPYFDAPQTAVKFFGKKPNPVDGKAGDKVTFEVIGLDKLKDYKFFINQIQAEIVNVTDSLATVIIPEGTSSGPAAVLTTDGQYFYGPILKIDGKVSADATFKVGSGTNGPIYTAYYNSAGNGMFLLGGSFTDFNSKSATQKINGIVKLSSDGSFLDYDAGKGAYGGLISTILPLAGQYYIGGIMSTYGDYTVDGITRINDDCSLDVGIDTLINPNSELKPEDDTVMAPKLNAYLSGNVVKLFEDANHNIISVGNITQYYSYYYQGSQKNNYYIDRTVMYNFVKIDDTGAMDSTYNFDPVLGYGPRQLNGNISDAIQLPDGKIIFVGSFTKFGTASAPKIGALTDDGALDPTFAAAIGSGADGDVYRITYNKTTGHILLTGDFTHFDGHQANGIVMLNADGTYNGDFKLKSYSGGSPNYAGQLDNGMILVSGTFSNYDNTVRQGFMILNADGTLAEGYNNTGAFTGAITGHVETSAHSVVIYGLISLFDNVKVGNIVKIAFD